MRKYVIGALIGFTLALATNAFAAIGDKVEAVYAEFNYLVNGETKTLESPVLVVDGNSYLRTTQVANLLGYSVTYDADGRTIEFDGTLPAASSEPSASPETSQEPSAEPTESPAPTESPSGSEAPTTSPEPSAEPSTSPEPSETPAASEEPADDAEHLAACQAIRDSWNLKIYTYEGKNPKEQAWQREIWTNEMNSELASAGC